MADQESKKASANRRSSPTATSASKKPAKKPAKKPTTKAPVKRKAVKKKAQRATKIDWDLAFQFYCESMTRTYEDVAKKYGVHVNSVYEQSKKSETPWPDRRLVVIEKAEKNARKRRYKDVTERDDSHLTYYRNLQSMANKEIKKQNDKAEKGKDIDWKTLKPAMEMGDKGVMGERIILGLPTLIARSEAVTDDETLESTGELLQSARLLTDHLERLEKYRNNG